MLERIVHGGQFNFLSFSLWVLPTIRSWKLRWTVTDRSVLPLNFDVKKRPRRQDWNGEFLEAGMFYFARRRLIQNDKLFQNNR